MITFDNPDSLDFDLQAIPIDAIALSDQDRGQAAQWSQVGFGEAQQWQIYRNALAVLGVKEWLNERGIQLVLEEKDCSLFNPVAANLLNAVAQLQIGECRISICVLEDDPEDGVALPHMLYRYSPFCSHLYLWVLLSEEMGWVAVKSGLCLDDLISVVTHRPAEWSTLLPDTVKMMGPSELLLTLRCEQARLHDLDISVLRQEMASQLTSEQLLQTLESWSELTIATEILSAEDGLAIMRSPQLSELFTQTLQQKFSPSLWSSWMQTGINVGRWWADTVETAVEEFAWMTVPSLSPAMRSQNAETTDLFELLRQQGVEISEKAEVRYHDLSLGPQSLRLFAMAWPLEDVVDNLAWTLLVVLCSQPNQPMTEAVQLDVRDVHQNLATETITPGPLDGCRFIQVSGELGEHFWVTLSLLNRPQMTMTLPPFYYESQTGDSSWPESGSTV